MLDPRFHDADVQEQHRGMIEHKGVRRSDLFDPDYSTHHSRHGYGIDVRATYANLPFQPFWTWLTGKHLTHHEPRKPVETLLSPVQLGLQLLWSWSIIALSLMAGYWALHAQDVSLFYRVPVIIVAWVLITNRTRGLLHTFHYTNHGASLKNDKLARFLAKWFMSIPILHLAWSEYHAIHARDHHAMDKLCTERDPDEVFMTDHGFYSGMPEREFWFKLVTAPFHPKAMWGHISSRLRANFVNCSTSERVSRAVFWVALIGIVAWAGLFVEFAVLYLVPLLFITQFSSWLQHTTEHLWFARKPENLSNYVYYASLTWGRFQGRPYPVDSTGLSGVWMRLVWWCKVFVIDVPVKVFSFMQDLPSHDYHHRSPKVNFWSISRERAAAEGLPSRWGPMAEAWGLMESWRIVRDHVCYGESDPFGIWNWELSRNAAASDFATPADAILRHKQAS
jgi:hypothetical protein